MTSLFLSIHNIVNSRQSTVGSQQLAINLKMQSIMKLAIIKP